METPPATPEPEPTGTPPVTPPAAPPTEPLVYPTMDAASQPQATPATPEPTSEPPRNWSKTVLLGILNWLVVPAAIVLVLHYFVFQAFHVIGSSMVPMLNDTDYLIVSKIGATEADIARAFHRNSPYIPKRYEIVIFHFPQDPTLVFVKRVIALPGERVVVSGGKITVYNNANPGGFNPDVGTERANNPTLGDVDTVVPDGNIFVVGDNRTPNGSYDSREWGTLPSRYIIGEAIMRLLPIDKIRSL